MFKLESYITPIILSYVNRYINNFKPEDSQVSLWGGDATFHNLELNLEVLEQELQLPFSFVSGSIRELSIHVPWTKITSEPIRITINTIECILNLKGRGTRATPQKRAKEKAIGQKSSIEPPPGYIQSLINKIVSNICIHCNNLILKYVEEDIVLSMNVKLLKFEGANEKWEPAYTDPSPAKVILRKIISITDLTLCLDKRNASGKIEVYQEPMLYRCSMSMHLLRHYHSATASVASTMRLDIYCNNMEFSMTEQQVPMLIRLILLLYALQQKQLKPDLESLMDTAGGSLENQENQEDNETWTGWAWSAISSVLPAPWEDSNWDENELSSHKGHTLHLGFYVDRASITFKQRYHPMLTLDLQGIYIDTIIHGLEWFNCTGGISEASLIPLGYCSCGYAEVNDNTVPYLKLGSMSNFHKLDSLFDAEAIENRGGKRQYNTQWDLHMTMTTESVLLEKTPALAFDYAYKMDIPIDISSEDLSEYGSNYEFSNFSEISSLRLCIGPFRLRVCSGLIHRANTIQTAASFYDYPPYYTLKPDLPLQNLQPPSEEDFDALNKFIPSRSLRLTLFAPLIELELMDHPCFEPNKTCMFKRSKKSGTMSGTSSILPKITIECQFIDLSQKYPMYYNRLVHTTCQLPEPPKKLFDSCYVNKNIKIVGLLSRLVINSACQSIILTPSNVSFSSKTIIKPHYWINSDIPHNEMVFESESVTLNGTKAKMLVAYNILEQLLLKKAFGRSIYSSSLLTDACKDFGFPHMEICIEGIRFIKVITNSTQTFDISIQAIKAFIFETIKKPATVNIQQVLFISGPEISEIKETKRKSFSENSPLLTITVQFPLKPELQKHPPILLFNLQEIRISSGSMVDVPRRLSQLESVHSSSDREHQHLPQKITISETATKEDSADVQEKVYNILKSWFDVWKGIFLCGDVSQCTIYFPMSSLSAVGSQGIQEAVQQALNNKDKGPDILVITLPFANIRSAQRQNIGKYLKHLPVALPDNIWTADKSSFPWTMSISELSCYTMQNGEKLIFLKPVSLSATVGLSTRPSKNADDNEKLEKSPKQSLSKSPSSSIPNSPTTQIKKSAKKKVEPIPNSPCKASKIDIGSLGVCVHIDTTPILISTSEVQVYLFASILYGLMEVASNLLPTSCSSKPLQELPGLTKGSSTLSHREQTTDNLSEITPPSATINTENLENDSVKLTAWIQWTITRFTIELLSGGELEEQTQCRLKLVVDAEDIVSSLDFQSIYLKVKSKIGSASIRHYERQADKWQPGSFSGIVMRLRDDLATRQEDSSLISVTITRASCQHTHTLWGALLSKSRYITEIVVNIQPLDFVISLYTLKSFYLILIPLLTIPASTNEPPKNDTSNSFLSTTNNQSLPLAYLDCQDIRVIMPSRELLGCGTFHDVLVFQLQKISLNPQAVNPICRTPIRSDIYDQAAHARILNIPGSEVEDRQYQLDIVGISVCTGTWADISTILSPSIDRLSSLRGMSENPALEWNISEQGQPNMTPSLNLKCILEKFDITIVAAPSMVYKGNVTICGHSMEINLVSDILINFSLQQIKLLSAILTEFVLLVTPLIREDGTLKKIKIKFPYSHFDLTAYEKDSDIDVRDSGIETSDFKSVQSSKTHQNPNSDKQVIFPRPPNTVPYIYSSVPIEVVLTAGKIGLTLYSVEDEQNASARYKGKKKKHFKNKTDEDQGYEASEESTDDRSDSYKKYIPLLYLSFTQPNAFYSKQQLSGKIQLSCFDINLKLSNPEYAPINHLPTETDFPVNLLETKTGTPNTSNGILPAFFTFRLIKGVGKNSKIELEILKPTKLFCQNSKWSHLLTIKDKVVDIFKSGGGSESFFLLLEATNNAKSKENALQGRSVRASDTFSKFQRIRDLLGTTSQISFKSDQLILAISSENGPELHVGMRQLRSQLLIATRPEKIGIITTFDCLTLTVLHNEFRKLLLNPWTITFDVNVFWESWQDFDSEPQVQITAESDCILIDVTSEQIKCLEMVLKELKEFLAMLPSKEGNEKSEVEAQPKITDKDQHYKDDLRAGAFQFVDSNTDNADEMPLPYQVMFWTKKISAMAWKYPQPRALTKVRVFPVPYKMALTVQENISVLCHLEYWSECRNCYLPYTQFCLSESEICHLTLPEGCPKTVVASTWRVVITTIDDTSEEPILNKGGISPRALAACMRIDSYFNKNLIPNLNVALYVTKIELALYNYFSKNTRVILPNCLRKYYSDLTFPESQKFLTLTLDNLSAYLSIWSFEELITELSSSVHSTVLDYGYLTEQKPFTSKLELCLSKGLQSNFISKPIQVKFGPSIAHTLAISAQMWTQNNDQDFIMVTRYVICNDTNVSIRFGQCSTEENVLVASRAFHLYSWKSQRKKQLLRVSLEENNWNWSTPFPIYKEGTRMIHFKANKKFTLFVTIKNISKTQKQITFFGQLIVCNMLSEHFEMKVIEAVSENKEQEFRNAQNHVVGSRTAAPSVFISDKKQYFLRLRFFGLDSAWTGDIPLREHVTGSQPWLVKVPLQERGQFLSIWCRIFIQDFVKSRRILAMLWPLFMVKSNLPMSAKVHIETPTLRVHLDSVVNGKGELQQLYCPGTIDHSHQITFQLEEALSNANNPYVPLNYTLVDQREFFKKSSNDEIETILASLNHCFESKWPYFEEEFDDIEWIMDDSQPLTHVQVRYQNACPYSCALLVELLPWCLMVNTLGTPVSVLLNGIELCRIQHHGIIAPPKLEENFHLGVCTGTNWFFSGPLQLAKSDWAQSFYMPKITGNIPLEGTIKTCVKCDSHLCMISVTSTIANEIRLLRLSSTHILSNHLSTQVHVICFAIADNNKNIFDWPEEIDKHCFTVAPHSKKSHSGIPIMQWFMLKNDSESSNADYVLYISFSVNPAAGWSCPIRVDKPLLRKAFAVQNNQTSMPVVLTAQEIKGQVFLALHNDPRPQIFIENKTNVLFYCGQTLPDETSVVAESEHFKWNCILPSLSGTYYNMPAISQKFPELPQVYFAEKLSLAYESQLEWSTGISIVNNNDLFIRVPYYGDVKLTIVNTACITFLTIESVGQVEISARDIRVRLSMRDCTEKTLIINQNEEIEQINLSPSSFQKLPTVAEQFPTNFEYTKSQYSDRTLIKTSWRSNLLVSTLPLKDTWANIKFNIFIKSFGITLISDVEENEERWEIANLTCDDIIIVAQQNEHLKVKLSMSDIQFDNQLHTRASYDFPVVLVGQDKKPLKKINILNIPMEALLENFQENSLVVVDFVLESWANESQTYTGIKTMKLSLNPIACFIEDRFVTKLMHYMKDLNIVTLVIWPVHRHITKISSNSISVNVPELVSWQCALLARPLTMRTFVVSPLSMLLSVHSSMKMYIALDQSPLQFSQFERRRLFTTSYRLGHSLTMHYLSGAIFGAGWVVSSLELLGSPGGLARAMGTGLRDFVSLPYRGFVHGPMAFLKGITTGSASLMKHVTAGTLQSVTKLASSVARNLDRLTLDEEHQRRTEEQRRQRPQGVAQGFMQGMTAFGISLLGAVGGIAHHPLQSMMSSGASPRSLAAGVGLGIVGVFTKPLSGAAEFVAMTGQGLLQGAGWNSLPDPRSLPQTIKIEHSNNSNLKYPWKLGEILNSQILFVTEATSISHNAIFAAVALILTVDSFVVVNLENDEIVKVVPLTELSVLQNADPTILTLKHLPAKLNQKDLEKVEDELAINMDPEMRARVADYVRSTVGLLNPPEDVSVHSGISISPLNTPDIEDNTKQEGAVMNFYIYLQNMRYFVQLLNLATQQRGGNHFSVL
ncbi:unnamed protein product [Ceutorhynchus assimilis]|uniref:Vacuolar protein sorting-associated protein 13B n=1 Tax=Ceutorhynchus assimilis TaxID=467358 RepID=A0A9N9N0P1_9CUCU|nr:unnamed protein product [Ceutorhynchus assimilis]